MILLDVNILLAAHRADHPHHTIVRPWFDDLVTATTPFAVPGVVWAGFIRIATNRRIFPVPTAISDAFDFLRAVCAQPHYISIIPGERHLELFEQVCRDTDAAGDLAADAYLVAFAIEQGCELASLDRDFARFSAVAWIRPGEGTARS